MLFIINHHRNTVYKYTDDIPAASAFFEQLSFVRGNSYSELQYCRQHNVSNGTSMKLKSVQAFNILFTSVQYNIIDMLAYHYLLQ
jgi:hypothetical protein